MNLKEEIAKIEIYSNKVKKLLNLIDEYIDMYNKFNNGFEKIVTNLKEDFKVTFENEGFKVVPKRKDYNCYERYNELVAEHKRLEFKLVDSYDGTTNMYFEKSKPENESIFIDIELNTKEYRINIDLKNIKKISGINDIKEIRKSIDSSKYTVEEINTIHNAIENNKVNLSKEIKKLENYYFIGIEKDKGSCVRQIEFKTIEELIKEI